MHITVFAWAVLSKMNLVNILIYIPLRSNLIIFPSRLDYRNGIFIHFSIYNFVLFFRLCCVFYMYCQSHPWFHHINDKTECCGRVVSTPASYSAGPRFKDSPEDRLYWLFVVFLSPYSTLQLGHDRFLSHTFQFIIQLSPVHSSAFIVWVTEKRRYIKYKQKNKTNNICLEAWIMKLTEKHIQ
jgi:hypothetical protein